MCSVSFYIWRRKGFLCIIDRTAKVPKVFWHLWIHGAPQIVVLCFVPKIILNFGSASLVRPMRFESGSSQHNAHIVQKHIVIMLRIGEGHDMQGIKNVQNPIYIFL